MITVVDYGAANLMSITRALEAAGASVQISDSPEAILAADAVALPGVGAAGEAMRRLRASGADQALRDVVAQGRPLLGVCLGMQLFFGRNEEDDAVGLDILPGVVTRLRGAPKTPHMGWNTVAWATDTAPALARTVLRSVPPDWQAYFAHSYSCQPEESTQIVAWTEYGAPICAAVCRDNLLGVQFHPEKSGAAGVGLLRAWVAKIAEERTR